MPIGHPNNKLIGFIIRFQSMEEESVRGIDFSKTC